MENSESKIPSHEEEAEATEKRREALEEKVIESVNKSPTEYEGDLRLAKLKGSIAGIRKKRSKK